MKPTIKDLLNLSLRQADKDMKSLTDKQLTNIYNKLSSLKSKVEEAIDNRFLKKLEDEADDALDDQLEFDDNEEIGEEEEGSSLDTSLVG